MSAWLSSPGRIMVFAPHPDDDILGCGGVLIQHATQGRSIQVVYLTSGEMGSCDQAPEELAWIREEEAVRALSLINIDNPVFMRWPDGGIEISAASLNAIVMLLRRERPDLVYVPHAHDMHRDHLKTHELILEACRRSGGPWHPECGKTAWQVGAILAYEVWAPLREVNLVEDITRYMPQKLLALAQHRSQLKDIAYDEGIRALNRFRGVSTGRGDYCECFQIIKIC